MARWEGEKWVIEPLAQFTAILQPNFEDLLPTGSDPFGGFLNDFVVMDDIPYHKPVIDIFPKFKILARRDASCDLVYKQIGKFAMRDIETHELFGGTKMCKQEFYSQEGGALRNFRDKDMQTFGKYITPFFQGAIRIDMATNVWFGDINRTDLSTYQFSTTAFPGVFKWIATYIASGDIPAGQTFTPAATDYRDPAHYQDAYNAILAAWQKQSVLMRNWPPASKIMYVDLPVLEGYREYMKQLGTESKQIQVWFQNGVIELDQFNGIPIVAVPIWEPVLQDLNGNTGFHHTVLLTVRKNLIFGTDKNYGEGPDLDMALVIWYRQIDLSWYYQQFLKAGTQIALPSFIVYGTC